MIDLKAELGKEVEIRSMISVNMITGRKRESKKTKDLEVGIN